MRVSYLLTGLLALCVMLCASASTQGAEVSLVHEGSDMSDWDAIIETALADIIGNWVKTGDVTVDETTRSALEQVVRRVSGRSVADVQGDVDRLTAILMGAGGQTIEAVSKTMVSALTGTGDGRARSASQDRIARRAAIPPTIIRLTSVQDLKSLSVNLPTHINDSVTFEVLASVFANSPGIPLPVSIKGTFSNQTVFAQYIDGVHILDVKPIGRPRRTKATPSSVAQTVQPTMVLPLLLPPSHKSFTMRLVLVQEQSTTGLLKRSPTGVISSLPLLGMDDSNQQYGVTLVGTMAGTASDYCRLYGYSLAKATTSNLDTLRHLVWSYAQDAKAWVESYNAELYGQSALLLRVRAANDTFSEPVPVNLPGAVAICERSGVPSDGQVCIKRGYVISNAVVPSAQAAATCHKAGRTLVSLHVQPDIKAIGRLLADCFGAGAAVWVKDWEGHPNAPCVQVLAGVASAGALNSTVAFPSSCTQKAHALCV